MTTEGDDQSPGVMKPSDVSFADAHERLQGPILGPIVLPDHTSELVDDIDQKRFASEKEVRQWAHEAGRDLDEVRSGIAEPFVTTQEIADGWIVAVYTIESKRLTP
ncbi:hypothetical protein HLRTI_002923 [Halorhabdus tiamatea SARL4B]|uniref:Uncharacterized protein n=1 Tax=Halorhabdus tiamatea SARL4B TaxID=1033806 RepID=U2F9E6_9EURY|nr:hypothetical protein [Halorhabdus tiamatea]ERJ05124.1 hypothetical protein HLRTI_002923 [Halorhabdus tiamatea SARL4B]